MKLVSIVLKTGVVAACTAAAADLSKGSESKVLGVGMGALGYLGAAFNACGGELLTAAPIASGIGAGVGLAVLLIQSKIRNGTFKFWQ